MNILIAEDDAATRRGIEIFLKNLGFEVLTAENGAEALQKCQNSVPDLVLSDVKMPQMNGLKLLERIRKTHPKLPVLMMTAFASVEDAVLAMKQGADDYLIKPLNLEELRLKLLRLREKAALLKENRTLRAQLEKLRFPEIVGMSKAMQTVFQFIEKAAEEPDIPVMIYGESGTGKELVARAIHRKSPRSQRAFVPINCSAVPENLIESELFGYTRGAFTGATQNKPGLFQSAQGGTLFLDEVSEMSAQMQAKLLRVLQEGRVKPVGGTREIPVSVRVIGASNRNLREDVAAGLFRKDLFYRLNVLEITLPPLRERREDIPLLIQHFAEKYAKKGTPPKRFSREAVAALSAQPWGGNVRELENAVRVALVTSTGDVVTRADVQVESANSGQNETRREPWKWNGTNFRQNLRQVIADFEREFIAFHLNQTDGNVSKTAEKIGLSRAALHKKIKSYGLKT